MDDLLYGAHSMTSALELQQELIRLLQSGGFNLRKWNSNKEELLNINNNQDNKNFNFKHAHSSKTLGLSWISKQDIFTFQTKITDSEKKCTKRSLLSEISKQFDPIGLIAPITWDDELPEEILVEWINMKHGIKMIDQLQIPRWLGTKENSLVELHGFCDSSERAFGCAIYCRTSKNHHSMVVLVAAKTRLVPIKKPITIPRLELNAAVLLSKLMNKVVNCLSTYNIQSFGWCDSTAVLGWLHGDAARWKPFVANRVKQVITNMPPACWRYVKSEENPADCASRGLTAGQLKGHPLWWQGPSWLLTYKQDVENNPMYTTNEEEKQVLVAQKAKEEEKSYILPQLIEKQSSFTRLVRILAWILRVKKDKTKQRQPYLTISELQTATNLLIKHVQSAEFKDDINNITQNKQVPKKSPLSKLNPFIDKNGILRVDGRLELANITYNMKHPIILPNRSRFTQLLIDSAHKITFHGGARLTSAFIRQKYWIVGGNRTIKRLIRTCITCRRHAPSIQPQIMGDLPEARTNPSRPFYHTGVDYTGYVDVKASKGRGIKTNKGYVAVFVCMATKAVHLELVSDLTSSAFLAALRRMAARRGAPRHIYCDNGTNFVGASRVLEQNIKQLKENISDPEFLTELTKMEIEFHFNAPSWPSAGGLWEAAVKSLKYHIKRVIGEQKLTFEEYSTILTQLEACLNTRPLCALTEDVEDLDFLTPSHFLTGTADVTILETEHDARTRWNLTEKLMADIWKRWKSEYLTQLTVRNKWKQSTSNIQVGQLVTIQEDNLPAGKWLTGRVIHLHPGKDGFVRVVSLKTKNGILKRPVTKLSILPLRVN
ncbi:unnamed protein product [Parnassius mnemosyne]|uniref:Integrase catalytic domain-containing protein n=1 Tax=Parnassius mnemosyne TaxID=213953 RepID=A0AAV1L338_9NEOP